MSSDHLPIQWTIDEKVSRINNSATKVRWIWKKANWATFKEEMETAAVEHSDISSRSVKEAEEIFHKEIMKAAENNIPRVRAKKVEKEWLTKRH